MSEAADAPGGHDRRERYPRYLGDHETQTVERKKPIDHNYTGTFVLDDTDLPAPLDAPEYSHVPDGSLYQRSRVTVLNADDDEKVVIKDSRGREKEYVVLTREYNPNWLPGSETFAVTLLDSSWQAGIGEDDDYSPLYKYDLKMWPTDTDGQIQTGYDLLHSLTVKVIPQYNQIRGESTVYPDGSEFQPPIGEGTKLRVSTTWAERAEEAFTRAHDMIRQSLGHSMDVGDIYDESKTSLRQEAHVRFHKSKAADLKHALQQSADLIPHKNGDIDNYDGEARNGTWELFRFQSSDWHLIGGRDTGNVEIGIKIYFTADHEEAEGHAQHPKCEAWLADSKGDRVPWAAYDDMQQVLEELVISHLIHAGVRREHLIADDMFKPSERPTRRMEYSNERREWLREHYQSLEPAVFHEGMREQTALPYDILCYLVHNGETDYDELAEATGAARRTIREHVRRLEQDVGGESPGILKRIRSSKTVVTFAHEMWQVAREAVEKVRPDDTPDDRDERADDRREQREEREQRDDLEASDEPDDEQDDLGNADELFRDDWRRLSELSAGIEQARTLPQDAIKVNIRHPNWQTDPAG